MSDYDDWKTTNPEWEYEDKTNDWLSDRMGELGETPSCEEVEDAITEWQGSFGDSSDIPEDLINAREKAEDREAIAAEGEEE